MNNINPFLNNRINSRQNVANQNNGALNYNVRFGNGQNYDSFESSSSNKETKSFWQKWKGIIIGGAGLLCVSILGVIGYNKGWFKKAGDKIKEITGKTSSKAASKAQENVPSLNAHLKTLKISSQKFGTRTISDMIKNSNVSKQEFKDVATKLNSIKNKENQAAIIFILNQLRQHLSVEIKDFKKDKEISEDNVDTVLKTILKTETTAAEAEEPKAKEPKAKESKAEESKAEESKVVESGERNESDSNVTPPNPPLEPNPSGGGSGRISDTSDIPDNTYHEYDYDKTNFTSFNVKAIDEMRQKQIQKIKEINSANVEEYKENTINFLKIVDSNFEKIKNNPILLNKICNYLTSILNQNNSILYLAIHNNEEGRGVFNNIFYKLSATVEEQSTGNEYMEDFFCDYFKCCQYKLYKADKKEKKIALENVIKLKQLRHNTNMSDINLNLINDFLYLGLWNFSKKEDKETDTALFNQFIDFTLQDNTTKHYALSYIIQAQTMGYELKEEYKNKLLNMIENVQKPELWSYLDKQATNINNMRQLGFYNIDKDGTIFQALTKKLKELDPGNKRKFLFYEEQEEVTPNRNCEFLTRVKNIQLFNNFLIQNPNIKTVYSITQDDLANMLTKIINTPNLSTDDLNEMRQELENLEKSIAQYRLLLRSNPEESKIIGITKNTVDNLVVIKKELEELIVFLTNEQKQDNEKEEKINRIKTCCEKITSNVERKTKFDFDIDTYLEAQENTNDEDNTKKYDYSYMIQSAHSKVNSNYDSSDTNVLLIALNSYVYRNNFSKNITNSQEYKNFRKIIRDNMELIDDKTAGVGTINGTLIDKYIENFSYIQQ